MRIVLRTSKWAVWARRLGSLAVPLTVLPVLMHREGFLDSANFLVVALAACAVAGLAVLVSLIALVRLWQTGDRGWDRALSGLVLALACAAPFAWYGYLAWHYPVVTDMATAPRNQLPLIFEPDTAAMPPPRMLPPDEQGRRFPNAATRSYPLDPVQLFALAERLVQSRGWEIRLRREPGGPDGAGRLNARILTLPGWREEAVLRVFPAPEGAAVDMRSASIGAPHDFGSNGNRISEFMVALDNEVTTFLRDNPGIDEPIPMEAEPSPDVESESG